MRARTLCFGMVFVKGIRKANSRQEKHLEFAFLVLPAAASGSAEAGGCRLSQQATPGYVFYQPANYDGSLPGREQNRATWSWLPVARTHFQENTGIGQGLAGKNTNKSQSSYLTTWEIGRKVWDVVFSTKGSELLLNSLMPWEPVALIYGGLKDFEQMYL